MAQRGQITQELQEKAKELLGWDAMTQRELRMLPYIQYCLVNQENLDPRRYHREDIRYMKQKGWVLGGASDLLVTREFWDAMCELILVGYVMYEDYEVGNPNMERDKVV